MTVRPARRPDALAIATAHVRSWQAAYAHVLPAAFLASLSIPRRASQWEAMIDAGESTTEVAEANGLVSGFVSHGRCRDDDAPAHRGEIWALYTAPEVWGQGLGRALLGSALSRLASQGCTEASLWVLAENARGRRFYEAHGFAPVPGSGKWFELGGVKVQEVQYIRRHAA